QLLEFRTWIDSQAVVLALGDHQPSCQRVAELGGQRQPPFVVELGRVGAEEHTATSPPCSGTPVAPLPATLPHIPPLSSTHTPRVGKNSPLPAPFPPNGQVSGEPRWHDVEEASWR